MRRQRAALQVLPEGELAEQAVQTLLITQLPTLAPSPPCCARAALTVSKMEGTEKGNFVVRGR